MTYKEKKKLEEEKFVNHLLKVGIETKCESSEGRNTYYCFWLINGEQRYWVNLSEENRKKLGFKRRNKGGKMKYYLFTRLITKREAINKYGKMGFTTHKECVPIIANSIEEANKIIEPFNYKKHIKFIHTATTDISNASQALYIPETIVDLGVVDDLMD